MRSDNIQEEAYSYIRKWQHNDQITRIDTNTWKVHKSINPFTNEEQQCSRRIWSVIGAERQFQLFINSQEYKEFQNMTNNATIGTTLFKKYFCSCTRAPTPESCVDPLISGMQHLMVAIKEGMEKLPDMTKAILESLPGFTSFSDALRKERAVAMVEACCCPREEQHNLKVSDTIPLPRFFRFTCSNGTCGNCDLERRLGMILNHPLMVNNEIQLSVCILEEAQ
jgi:hypothetical protein